MSLAKGLIVETDQIATAEFGPEFECQSCASGVQQAWSRVENARSDRALFDSHAAVCDDPLCGPLGRIVLDAEQRTASSSLLDRTRHAATTHANGESPCDTTGPRLFCAPM
jgi:hypothetical protein